MPNYDGRSRNDSMSSSYHHSKSGGSYKPSSYYQNNSYAGYTDSYGNFFLNYKSRKY